MQVYERPFFNIAVFRIPLQTLSDLFTATPVPGLKLRSTDLDFPLQKYHTQAGEPPMLLWSPRSNPEICAFMPSVESGDYFVTTFACKRFNIPGVAVRSTVQEVPWPINEFIAYEGGPRRRIVRAMRESTRWDFFADGEPLEIEATDLYGARKIRNRFNRGMVLSYLRMWGSPIEDDSFWDSSDEALTFVRAE